VKVVYRKFGYVCLITVSTDYCVIDDEPGYQQTGQSGTSGKPRQYGQAEDEEKKCPNNYGYGYLIFNYTLLSEYMNLKILSYIILLSQGIKGIKHFRKCLVFLKLLRQF
jgi:hypothetical protein